jgi:hypothetical protein
VSEGHGYPLVYVITDPTHTSTHTLSLSPSPLQPENAHLLTFQALANPFCSRFNVAAGNYVVRVGSRRVGSKQTSCDCAHLSFLHLARIFGIYLFFYDLPCSSSILPPLFLFFLLPSLSLFLFRPFCVSSVSQSVHRFARFDVLFFSLKDPSGLGSMKIQRGGTWDVCQGLLLQCFSKNIEPGSFFSIL